MADAARVAKSMSVAEFLAWEDGQPEPHELHDGEIFAMSGASVAHNTVAFNAARLVADALRAKGGPCRAFTHGMKVSVPAGNVYYPDVLVICSRHPLDALAVDDPVLIVEVLSPSTESFDRGAKWRAYQTIPTLQTYMLIDPAERAIETYTRAGEGWTYVDLPATAESVSVEVLGVTLAVAGIYEGVLAA